MTGRRARGGCPSESTERTGLEQEEQAAAEVDTDPPSPVPAHCVQPPRGFDQQRAVVICEKLAADAHFADPYAFEYIQSQASRTGARQLTLAFLPISPASRVPFAGRAAASPTRAGGSAWARTEKKDKLPPYTPLYSVQSMYICGKCEKNAAVLRREIDTALAALGAGTAKVCAPRARRSRGVYFA